MSFVCLIAYLVKKEFPSIRRCRIMISDWEVLFFPRVMLRDWRSAGLESGGFSLHFDTPHLAIFFFSPSTCDSS